MTQEALKLVLPLLEDCVNSYGLKYERPAFVKAITAIKEALAQPEQEPVAWRTFVGLTDDEHNKLAVDWGCLSADWILYAAAVERAVKEKNT